MNKTIQPILIALLRGARNSDDGDDKRIKAIANFNADQLQRIDDIIVDTVRREVQQIVIDTIIENTARRLSENTETATTGHDEENERN